MIAKLERRPLREAFPSEVKDLSRWIQENLEELVHTSKPWVFDHCARLHTRDRRLRHDRRDCGGGKDQ